jgi:hypothetical protein
MCAGLFASVSEGMRGRPQGRLPVWLFALMPVLGFVVIEHLERMVEHPGVPYDLVLEPTFLIGLALQLPFALAALLLTRALYAIGYGLGLALARRLAIPRTVGAVSRLLVRLPASATLATPSVLGLGHGQRAPPVAASL